jgi:hypothetical protein
MDIELGIAGLICVALALGHETLGLVWVLPGLTEESVPKTRFGPRSMTVGMIRVSWHIVGIFALTAGGILLSLSWAEDVEPKMLVLRWFAAMWLAAAAMALWIAWVRTRSLRNLLRLPVPFLWLVIAVLCWHASI